MWANSGLKPTTTKREQIIEQLNQGCVTPHYLTETTDIESRQKEQYHLRRLRADRIASTICRGLYALDDTALIIIELVSKDGESVRATSRHTGVHRSTIRNILDRQDLYLSDGRSISGGRISFRKRGVAYSSSISTQSLSSNYTVSSW